MSSILLTLCAALALFAPRGPRVVTDEVQIHWGERSLRFDDLPSELSPSARAALEAWHDWSRAHAYRMDLDGSGRVLQITRASNDHAPRLLELADNVVQRFDRELPAPAVRLDAKKPGLIAKKPEAPKPALGDKPLPEDPEDPEGSHPWTLAPPKPVQVTSAPQTVTSWGSQGQPLDTQTMVLFVLHDQDDFESLLKNLAERFPFLAVWTSEAKALQGFVIPDPLAAAYLEAPDGVEEWNPDNELVNRLARLCLLRRFGDQPNWFVQGYAWHMEIAFLGGVYCFPWRDEFVYAVEHAAWPATVRERYAKTRLKTTDFMGWKRGKYLGPEAQASWGTSEYLVAKEQEKLPELLERLRVFREEHGRIQENPSSWRRNLEYEIPVGDQHKLFTEILGDGYLDRASFFFRKELVP